MSNSPAQPEGARPVRQMPEPARCWIAYTPRKWRAASGPYTDLANNRLGGIEGSPGGELPQLRLDGVDDLFYLPPAATEREGERDALARELLETGAPVLVQLSPGQSTEVPVGTVYDLLDPLVDRDWDRLLTLPAGCRTVWPLIAGLTDLRDTWDEACSLLAEAGVAVVQPMLLELTPFARRRLAEGRDEALFDALFHGRPPSERAFSRVAHRHGLEIFLPRPETGTTQRQRNNRRIAAELALLGELWLRLGHPVGQGQALLRAARGAESTNHDLVALVREENLAMMEWLDAANVELVEEIARDSSSQLLATMLSEYQAPEDV